MDILNIAGTDETPRIIFNAANGEFEISGRSLPEDATGFYSASIDWLNKFVQSVTHPFHMRFKLEYFNTASAKQLFRILSVVAPKAQSGGGKITWYYHPEDSDMLASGERFAKLLNLPIQMEVY